MKKINLDMPDTIKVDVNNSKIVNLGNLIDVANGITEGKGLYFVKMNVDDMRKRIAGTTHELRPFVVVAKSEDELKGFYTTSSLKGLKFGKECFTKYRTVLSNKKYKLNKSSVVLIDKIACIHDSNIIRMIDSIDNEDLAKILKMNALHEGSKVELKGKYLGEGDIIRRGNSKYLIYQKDKAFAYAVKVVVKSGTSSSKNYFDTENEMYSGIFNDTIRVSSSDRVILCDHVGDDILSFIKRNLHNRNYREKATNRRKSDGKRRR